MFEKTVLTLEEKVDYLYEKAKKDERRGYYKVYFRITLIILFVVYAYYMYFFFLGTIKEQLLGPLGKTGSGSSFQIDQKTINALKGVLDNYTGSK